jgi:hypothetical protein
MKQIILNIPDNKYPFILELVKNLGLEKMEIGPTASEKKALEDLEQGFQEVSLIEKGKKKGTTLKEFLNEL